MSKIKCPKCNQDTISSRGVDNLCNNNRCSYYLKDDVTNLGSLYNPSQVDIEKAIKLVMHNFNFITLKKCLVDINYQWDIKGTMKVPSIFNLQDKALNLIERSINSMLNTDKSYHIMESDGFVINCHRDNKKIYVKLSFIIETSDNW